MQTITRNLNFLSRPRATAAPMKPRSILSQVARPQTPAPNDTSTLGRGSRPTTPTTFSSQAVATSMVELEKRGDPERALEKLGFSGSGSATAQIGEGTFQSCDLAYCTPLLFQSAHRLMARDPNLSTTKALTSVLDEVGRLQKKNPHLDVEELPAMAEARLLPPRKPKAEPKPLPSQSLTGPLTSFDVEKLNGSTQKQPGLKQDVAPAKVIESEALAGKITDLAVQGRDPELALEELGFRGCGSDRVKIEGADFQSCEYNEAACELFISSHKLARVFPDLDNKAIVGKTLQTVASLKKEHPDRSMIDLTFDAVELLGKR